MLLATLVLAVIGAALGGGLGIAGRYFAVADADPLQKEIEAMMPGSQCGQCGFPGCSAAATALAEKRAKVNCCPPGGRALAERLAALLGVPLEGGEMTLPLLAAIEASRCTGCTRCYRQCPTDAIVGANGQIHVVLQSNCIGCAKCVEACPENCVTMQPEPLTLDNWHWTKPQAV